MATLGIGPHAVARAVAFAIKAPDDVEIGDIIRPTSQKLTTAGLGVGPVQPDSGRR